MRDPTPLHRPVLYQEIINALNPRSGGRYVDGTLGAGGHSYGILDASAPDGQLLGFDLDPQAISLAQETLAPFAGRYHLVHDSYLTLHQHMQILGWQAVNGIVLDFGVSSMQLDQPQRGFSFLREGPLDMRFDPTRGVSAAQFLEHISESELADILWRYGEEPKSRQLAAAILARRPITTTTQLAAIIEETIGRRPTRGRTHIHPATRSFQALRIAVNEELRAVEAIIPLAIEALAPGGKLAAISFHSLEDRIVKNSLRRESTDCICPPEQPICTCGHTASIRLTPRKAVMASEQEVAQNPRSRSAKLRIAQKI
jgi:16S rRNA (cytosine1402-N4)-methyltransferase